jgi:hypothetical protein
MIHMNVLANGQQLSSSLTTVIHEKSSEMFDAPNDQLNGQDQMVDKPIENDAGIPPEVVDDIDELDVSDDDDDDDPNLGSSDKIVISQKRNRSLSDDESLVLMKNKRIAAEIDDREDEKTVDQPALAHSAIDSRITTASKVTGRSKRFKNLWNDCPDIDSCADIDLILKSLSSAPSEPSSFPSVAETSFYSKPSAAAAVVMPLNQKSTQEKRYACLRIKNSVVIEKIYESNRSRQLHYLDTNPDHPLIPTANFGSNCCAYSGFYKYGNTRPCKKHTIFFCTNCKTFVCHPSRKAKCTVYLQYHLPKDKLAELSPKDPRVPILNHLQLRAETIELEYLTKDEALVLLEETKQRNKKKYKKISIDTPDGDPVNGDRSSPSSEEDSDADATSSDDDDGDEASSR